MNLDNGSSFSCLRVQSAISNYEEPQVANSATVSVLLAPTAATILLIGPAIIRCPLLTLPTKSAYFFTRAGFFSLALIAPLAACATHWASQIRRSILHYEGINPQNFRYA
ncbi:hypothetical protein BKA58DRAFT_374297 [Alternaria rosae]|uniref:uncharacterized protein n=1 Tax=Alternaria rosae TaxID=1187941 RepID=UPI001E8CC9D2|nr:uncharacterized protein BKA58DRAFT_374297 [Alternaria rosae]KAH6883015.1 hypothetical protein BKA58DRAFT_374297 [Alternaria rosae]